VSVYDPIAGFYDEWSRSVVEDVSFYRELAIESKGPVLELGVGTGRIAIPVAHAGIDVIGVDSSSEMLALCASRAAAENVRERLELRLGDLERPPRDVRVPLVIVPFRAYLHLTSDAARLRALRGAHAVLSPGGRLAFDVFRPSAQDVEETHGRWLEREPGIWERADWDTETAELVLSVRGPSGETSMRLHWAEPHAWRKLLGEAGFELEGAFGWFDRRSLVDGEDMVFIARRPVP
jgi:SAM-dependent methyltransferase